MKTVIDAVNQLKGNIPDYISYVYVGSSSNRRNDNMLDFTRAKHNSDKWVFVCTVEDLNKCVDEMSKAEWMKPVTSPIYTQAMADNGESPLVGMKCLIKMIGAYLPVTITYNSDHVIAFTYETDNGVVETCKQKELNNIDIKPITPPIELNKHECYEFTSLSKKTHKGYFVAQKGLFITPNGNFQPAKCTNIKLLEVKA